MESHLQSRIPLPVSKKQELARTLPRNPFSTINLNQRVCNSLANTKQLAAASKNSCSICLTMKKAAAVPNLQKPALDDYKGRYKNLLEKFEIVNNKLTLAQCESNEYKKKNEILEKKLAAAEVDMKSVRQDLRRIKATNKSNELTIGVLERKIAELSTQTNGNDENEELHLSRFGRSIRRPDKYQSS